MGYAPHVDELFLFSDWRLWTWLTSLDQIWPHLTTLLIPWTPGTWSLWKDISRILLSIGLCSVDEHHFSVHVHHFPSQWYFHSPSLTNWLFVNFITRLFDPFLWPEVYWQELDFILEKVEFSNFENHISQNSA